MRKILLSVIVLGLASSAVCAYDYESNKILIIPNKQQKADGYGHNIISNSNVAIIIEEPIQNSQKRTYKRKNYQRDFRDQNVYDPRNLDQYQSAQDYNQGYNDGYNDARYDYNQNNRYRQGRADDMFYDTFIGVVR